METVNGHNNSNTIRSQYSRNTSTAGNFSFATDYVTLTGIGNKDLVIVDFDKDGKPDIAVANSDAFKVTVFKNTSTGGVFQLCCT